jgi:hypothetical protein
MTLKLDLGCGPRKREGFIGVDVRNFAGVDVVADLSQRWPWPDGSVGEAVCSHFVEHLDAGERIHFVNELYRVLVPAGRATLTTPYWASVFAYGDLTHKWPPVTEAWYPYLNRAWRQENAPHNDAYDCDFDHTLDYVISNEFAGRPVEEQKFALIHFKDAAYELNARLVRR